MIKLCAFADEASQSLSGQIAALKRNGIDLIELRGVDGKNVAALNDGEAVRIKNELDAAGIRVWSLGSPYGKVSLGEGFDEKALFTQLHRLCRTANIFGCDKIRVFSFYDAYGKADEVERLLTESVAAASEYGVRLYHENEKDIYGDVPERVLELRRRVAGLCFVYDPANYIQCGVSPDESIPALAASSGYFHIKDVVAQTGELVPAGDGDGDIARILDGIDADITLTVEPHLSVFAGYSDIDRHEMKNKYTFKSQDEAFDTAVGALKRLLYKCGYRIGGKNEWKRA